MGRCRIFRLADIGAPFNGHNYTPPTLRDARGLRPEQKLEIFASGHCDVALFARAIAKIAYCQTVVRFGLDGFRSLLLPKITLGECQAIPYFVGTPLNLPPPPLSTNMMHAIQHANLRSNTGRLKLYLVYVRLFASSAHDQSGMPIYHVILGAPNVRPNL